jgi:hypothetical protein
MLTINIQDTPNQTVNVQLASQNCQIFITTKTTGLFVDLYVSNTLVIGGVLALNTVLIVRDQYLGFVGDLAFFDLQSTGTPGNEGLDPSSPGLGTRFLFCYIEQGNLTSLNQ